MSLNTHDLERDQGQVWEKTQLGQTTVERVVNMGNDIRDWRETASGMQQRTEDILMNQRFGEYVASLGSGMLKLVSSIEVDVDPVKARIAVKQKAIESKTRLKRKNVKVAGIDDSFASAKMDEEWDTSAWGDETIEDACNILFDVFFDPVTKRDEVRKETACLMLDKLMTRHPTAEEYVRRNVALLVGLSASRFVRQGQTAALLDLLSILHAARARFVFELSENNFAGRVIDMCVLECRLAVLLMQHTVRSQRMRQRNKERLEESSMLVKAFGTAEQAVLVTESSIVHRSQQLASRWRDLHLGHDAGVAESPIGFRGPVHIAPRYFVLILEIILAMVDEGAKGMAHTNREEVVRCGGCILLSQLMGVPHGPHLGLAARILSFVSCVAESLSPIMHSGCIRAALMVLRFFARTGKLSWATHGVDRSSVRKVESEKLEKSSPTTSMEAARLAFLDIIAMLCRAAGHAAGLHRARLGIECTLPHEGNLEAINYAHVLRYDGELLSVANIRSFLGDRALLGILFELLLDLSNTHAVRGLLRCLYSLACSDCFQALLGSCLIRGGAYVDRIVSLNDEQDATMAALALGMLLQICTRPEGRSGLVSSGLGLSLARRTQDSGLYSRRGYLSAMNVLAASLRPTSRRPHQPLQMPHVLTDTEGLRVLVYLDLLKSIRDPPLEEADALTIADLVVYPKSRPSASLFSQHGADPSICIIDLCAFLCRPRDTGYFMSLPWDESAGGCVILEALLSTEATCRRCAAPGVVRYLAQCLFYARLVLREGPPLSEAKTLLILAGVTAAAQTLGHLCCSANTVEGREAVLVGLNEDTDVMPAIVFFVQTLAGLDPRASEGLHEVQLRTGRSVLRLLDDYSGLVLQADSLDPSRRLLLISELSEAGASVVQLVAGLRFGQGVGATRHFARLLDMMCSFMARFFTSKSMAEVALSKWNVEKALSQHLPQPLSAVGEQGVLDQAYTDGLGRLPASYFDALVTLCEMDRGKAFCLTGGYLRRAIEKVRLLIPLLEPPSVLADWSRALARARVRPGQAYSLSLILPQHKPSQQRLEVAACLRLVAACASFTHEKYGAANDVVFFPGLGVLQMCKDLLSVDECPRCDPVCLAALAVFRKVAEDNFRAALVFESLELLPLVARWLDHVPFLPREGAENILTCVTLLAATNAPFVLKAMPLLREPIQKTAHVFPQLGEAAGKATWAATVSVLKAEKDAGGAGPNARASSASTWNDPHSSYTSAGTNGEEGRSIDGVFRGDRILREQLQRLYKAAGLDDGDNEAVPASAQQTPRSPMPSPGKAQTLTLAPLSITPSASPLASPASRASQYSPRSDFSSPSHGLASGPSSPSQFDSPLALLSAGRGMARGSPQGRTMPPLTPLSPTSSPSLGRGGGGGKVRTSDGAKGKTTKGGGSTIKVMSTETTPELSFTRPLR